MMDSLGARIARRVVALRQGRGLSLEALAARSGVSRSMISLIERDEASPTAVVLDRLAAGLSVSLSNLLDEEAPTSPLTRRTEQTVWRDPASGYVRRSLSPPGHAIQMVEVSFPAGGRVAYETGARDQPLKQQIWMLAGSIELTHGDTVHRLSVGDCLAMALDRPVVFANPGKKAARYVVVVVPDVPAPAARGNRGT